MEGYFHPVSLDWWWKVDRPADFATLFIVVRSLHLKTEWLNEWLLCCCKEFRDGCWMGSAPRSDSNGIATWSRSMDRSERSDRRLLPDRNWELYSVCTFRCAAGIYGKTLASSITFPFEQKSAGKKMLLKESPRFPYNVQVQRNKLRKKI